MMKTKLIFFDFSLNHILREIFGQPRRKSPNFLLEFVSIRRRRSSRSNVEGILSLKLACTQKNGSAVFVKLTKCYNTEHKNNSILINRAKVSDIDL